jgi:O-acetyl-ADP-ribose deacetylase (regulator of RNase III)
MRIITLVNPDNTAGISGKGLALEFKKRCPNNYRAYRQECKAKKILPGDVLVVNTGRTYTFNVATKKHWRYPSKMKALHLGSIAIPALGCGLGGLRWVDVKTLMLEILTEEM